MGCLMAVVEAVRGRGADNVITVKGNQPTPHDDVRTFLTDHLDRGFAGVPYCYQQTSPAATGVQGQQESRL